MTALDVYNGSSGDATKALYARLEALGSIGVVAMNVFRAHKCSARAKDYSRRYKGEAYGRKQWSMENLCAELLKADLPIRWGWKQDPAREFHNWVLYLDLPTGQVSFHTAARGKGPDYPDQWDGAKGIGSTRVCTWVDDLLSGRVTITTIAAPASPAAEALPASQQQSLF